MLRRGDDCNAAAIAVAQDCSGATAMTAAALRAAASAVTRVSYRAP